MHDPYPLTTLGNDGKLPRVQGGIPVPGEEAGLPALVVRCLVVRCRVGFLVLLT